MQGAERLARDCGFSRVRLIKGVFRIDANKCVNAGVYLFDLTEVSFDEFDWRYLFLADFFSKLRSRSKYEI